VKLQLLAQKCELMQQLVRQLQVLLRLPKLARVQLVQHLRDEYGRQFRCP
jgi:hypothetical protein